MEEIEEEPSWGKLPPHVIVNIMRNLNVTDIIRLSMSNKWYHKLATSNEVWKQRCLHLRTDILFLTIAEAHLPKWLERYDELQNDPFILNTPSNFYFVEFMTIWCRFPHAWKRGNQIVNTAYIQFNVRNDIEKFPDSDIKLTTSNGDIIQIYDAKEVYINWKKYYEIVIPQTFWLHNRCNGAYEIKRNTLTEPIFFQLPFSNGVSKVENNQIVTKKGDIPINISFILSNKKLEKRIENFKRISLGVAAISFTAAIGIAIIDAFITYSVPYHIIRNTFLKDDTCDIIYPTVGNLLDPNFEGSLIRMFDSSTVIKTMVGGFSGGTLSTVSYQIADCFKEISTALGLSSLVAYDTVTFDHPNNQRDLSIFITTENDIQNYHCAVMQAGLDEVDEYPIYWIHNMDESYDPLGSRLCSICETQPSKVQIEEFQMLGSFCGFDCALKAWNKAI